jgi:hypothetical protein
LGITYKKKERKGYVARQERKLGKKKARKFEDGEIRIEGEKNKNVGVWGISNSPVGVQRAKPSDRQALCRRPHPYLIKLKNFGF